MRILIVEDNNLIRTLLLRLYHPYGDTDAAATGEEALRLFEDAAKAQKPYLLISMDFNLGSGINGIETLRRMIDIEKEFRFTSKKIMITSLSNKAIVLSATAYCDDYILKPITREKLHEKLHDNGILSVRPDDPAEPSADNRYLIPDDEAASLEKQAFFADLDSVPVILRKDDTYQIYSSRFDVRTKNRSYVCVPAEHEPRFRNIPALHVIAKLDSWDIPLRCGTGVAYLPHSKVLLATEGGQVIFDGDSVHIRNLLRLDYPIIGKSLSFEGSIIITGDVSDGTSIHSGADIEIHGFTGNCCVRAGGDIFIANMNGKNEGSIHAGGSVSATHLYQTEVTAEKDIRVFGDVINSTLKARNGIFADKLIGGIAEAGSTIEISEAGSRREVRTVLRAGIDFDVARRLEKAKNRLENSIRESLRCEKMLGRHIQLSDDTLQLPPGVHRKMFEELGKYLCLQSEIIPEQKQNIAELEQSARINRDAEIRIKGLAHKALRLEIGEQLLDLTENKYNVTLHADSKKNKGFDMNTILIAGYGVSGQAAARLASFLKLKYSIADEKNTPEMLEQVQTLEHPPQQIFFGWTPNQKLPYCDAVIISPGIRETSDFYGALIKITDSIISELSFALRHIDCPIVAITGTNGKTTTTELTTALFRAAGKNAFSAGNIGTALSDSAIESRKKQLDLLVVEVSSFQLEHMDGFSPDAAAILNLASDHLDRHGNMDNYARIKYSIFNNLRKHRVLNINLSEYTRRFLRQEAVSPVTFSASNPNADFRLNAGNIVFRGHKIVSFSELKLSGKHNLENIMAALALLHALEGEPVLYKKEIAEALRNFTPDTHRMEFFLEKDGIRYINDSKATNPHAVNAALESVGTEHNVVLLLGGLDKNMDFAELKKTSGKVKCAFLTGQCAQKIYDILHEDYPCTLCFDFDNAVRKACEAASSGDIVMLSPATASMDRFKNYRERGDMFKKLVTDFTAEQ